MTVLVFDHSREIPQILAWIFPAGLAACSYGLFHSLNSRLKIERLSGPWHSRFWFVAGLAALWSFVSAALDPLLPGEVFGIVYWPVRAGGAQGFSHVATMAFLGACAFLIASDRGLAGSFSAWRGPVGRPAALGLLGCGAAAGAGLGLLGLYGARGFLLLDSLRRMGFRESGFLFMLMLPLGIALAYLAMLYFYHPESGTERGARWTGVAILLALWVAPIEIGEVYLRLFWDFGARNLAEAAGVPRAHDADSQAIVVLAEQDGAPGLQYREVLMAAGGVDASRASLRKIERYLKRRGLRTLLLEQALDALRSGWLLHWEPRRYLDATMVTYTERFPPDYDGFLKAMYVAPVSDENYYRLESMARLGNRAKFPQVKVAQKRFEGFSAAYARFGYLEQSNLWLDRIRGLWPLYEDDIHIEPIQEEHEGWISGRVYVSGRPARNVRVGLFALPSTTTVVGAFTALVDAAFPDDEGRFRFTSLTPGRYYLALLGAPMVFQGKDGEFSKDIHNVPGVIRLSYGDMGRALFPIEIGGEHSRFGLVDPPPSPPSWIPLPGLKGAR